MYHNDKNNKEHKVSRYEARRKLLVRIMAIFLCALMVLGTLVAVLPYIGPGAYASDSVSDTAAITEQTTSTIRTGTELVRIGLMYGTGVTVGFEVRADHGMNFGHVVENLFTPIWQTELTLVSATSDSNLSKNAMTYSVTSSADAKVGGWHVECDAGITDAAMLGDFYANVSAVAAQYGFYAFPAFINGEYTVRIGSFTTEAQAKQVFSVFSQVLGSMLEVRIAAPSLTGVSVLDPNTDIILFEYDSEGSELGITPIQSGDTPTYLVTPAKNQYEGIFEFSRYRSGSTDGVALTNILTLDQYVAGVLPYEISNTWPEEVQKAFAITVRTFTLSMYGRHTDTYGFDMCNSTH
nr:SpoIID/LytB domain-containing protein [Clostridia bacterium]